MFKNMLFLTSICGLTPAQAIVICGPVKGSKGKTLADALAHGDFPGISHVLVDGVPMVLGRSHQTPPPEHPAKFMCCNLGWISGGASAAHNLR